MTSAELSRLLDAFEEAIDDLRITYEKYFLGVERVAPAQKHRQLKAHMRRLERHHMRTTALRFRMQGLRAKLVTYEHYWTRILGQIEKGTYRRDLQQRTARRNEAAQRAEKARAPAPEPEEPQAEASDSTQHAPAAPGRSGPPPPPPRGKGPPPPPVPGMKSTEVRALFDDLVKAKQAAGEDTRGLTVRALARKLSRELPKLRERHGKPVEFVVATVRGKVTLRARTRNE